MSRNTAESVQAKSGSGSGSNKNIQSSEVSSSNKNGSSRPKERNSAATANIVVEDSSDDDNAEKIRVGKQYQATCPEMQTTKPTDGNSDDKALLVWTPTTAIDEQQIDDYVRTAQEKYGYNMEQALGMLYWHSYDLKSAMDDLCNFMPYPNEWSQEDEVLFEQAFQFHGKSFNRIRQMLPDKSVGSLVKYYYSWKKSRTKTSVMDRQEQLQAKNGVSDNNSERDSNSDVDDKNGIKVEGDATKTATDPINSSAINNCSGCGVACTEVHNTVHGKLCSSCHHHFKRTGILRPISAPKHFGKRSQTSDNGKYKKHPPKGIYFNHDDIVALAQAKQNPGTRNKQSDIVVGMERECASHWTRIQSNKQKLSRTRQKVAAALKECLKPDSNNRVSVRWTNDEYLLAVQGVKNHGKDFATIANILGTKTEAQIKTFFVNYRRRYNLDKLVREYDAKNGKAAKDSSSTKGAGKENATQAETSMSVEIDLDEENTNTNANDEDVTMTPVAQ
ncbi:REST corepressor 1-like [Culicoides brevitarsis]|uniref:REST corepressor 1-like n=1 Tax=Culicoides brevitarsis TaxID=469753 RepID=UPI00307C152A